MSALAVASVLLLAFSRVRRDQRCLEWLLRVALATVLSVEGLKSLTGLPRPDGHPTGFPSGHTTAMFALAWLLARIHPRLSPLWFAVAVSVGWARMEGKAHFPYQVICGAILGTIIGALVTWQRAPQK